VKNTFWAICQEPYKIYICCWYHWHTITTYKKKKERLCRHGFQNLIKYYTSWNCLLYSLFVCQIISET
jgi:hypothetical protein